MQRRLEAIAIRFYKRILRKPWMEHVNNKEFLSKMGSKITHRLKMMSVFKFLGHVMGKEGKENLMLIKH